jgi:hypothetical protein
LNLYCMDVDRSLLPDWQPVLWWQTGVEFKWKTTYTPAMVCIDQEGTTHWNLRPAMAGTQEQLQAIAMYAALVAWLREQCPPGTLFCGYSIPCAWTSGDIADEQVAHWAKIIPKLGFTKADSLGVLAGYKVYPTQTAAESSSMASEEAAYLATRCKLAVAVSEATGMDWGMFAMTRQKGIVGIGPDGAPFAPPIGRSLKLPEVRPLIEAVKQYGPKWLSVFHGNDAWCGWLANPDLPVPAHVRAAMRRQWTAELFPPGVPRVWALGRVRRTTRRNLLEWCDWIQDGLEATP